jgi:hypothetical protein
VLWSMADTFPRFRVQVRVAQTAAAVCTPPVLQRRVGLAAAVFCDLQQQQNHCNFLLDPAASPFPDHSPPCCCCCCCCCCCFLHFLSAKCASAHFTQQTNKASPSRHEQRCGVSALQLQLCARNERVLLKGSGSVRSAVSEGGGDLLLRTMRRRRRARTSARKRRESIGWKLRLGERGG